MPDMRRSSPEVSDEELDRRALAMGRPNAEWKTLAQHIQDAYNVRSCFVCGAFGRCCHREGRVEAAYIETRWAREKKPDLKIIPKTVGGGK